MRDLWGKGSKQKRRSKRSREVERSRRRESLVSPGGSARICKMPMPAKGNWRNTATIYTFLVWKSLG